MKFCPYCGTENPDEFNFCNNCKKALKSDAQTSVEQPQSQSPVVVPPPPPPIQQPVQPMPSKPQSNKKAFIAIAIVIVIIIAVLAAALIFMGNGNSSPEKSFNTFFDKWNLNDANGALQQTDAHFLATEDYNEVLSDMVDDMNEGGQGATLNSLTTRSREQMSPSEIGSSEEYKLEFEGQYGLIVQEYCMIDIIVSFESFEGELSSTAIPCIEVDNVWYPVFYGFGSGSTGSIPTPLGLNSAGRTTTTFTILVSSAPNDAMVAGSMFSFTHNSVVGVISDITLYSAGGVPTAYYESATGWTYVAPATADTLRFSAGMKLTITPADGVSAGDTLTISSTEDSFGTTQYVV